jgi:hypothetical protein
VAIINFVMVNNGIGRTKGFENALDKYLYIISVNINAVFKMHLKGLNNVYFYVLI